MQSRRGSRPAAMTLEAVVSSIAKGAAPSCLRKGGEAVCLSCVQVAKSIRTKGCGGAGSAAGNARNACRRSLQTTGASCAANVSISEKRKCTSAKPAKKSFRRKEERKPACFARSRAAGRGVERKTRRACETLRNFAVALWKRKKGIVQLSQGESSLNFPSSLQTNTAGGASRAPALLQILTGPLQIGFVRMLAEKLAKGP